MSYCRFAWDGSDVYVFGSGDGVIECCGCSLKGDLGRFASKTAKEMIEHLLEHRKKGDCVPQYAIDRLKEEATEKK